MKILFAVSPLIALLLSLSSGQAQNIGLPSGRSTEKPPALTQEQEAAFTYEAVDVEFWNEFSAALRDKNYAKAAVLAAEVLKDEKDSGSDEAEEAKLALAMALSQLKFSFGASLLLSELAVSRNNTKIGESALNELNAIAQNYYYDKESIAEGLLVSNEFGTVHSSIASFIGFHAGLYNLSFGFKNWADEELKKVKAKSFWDYELRYLKALGEVARDRFDIAHRMLEELYGEAEIPDMIKEKVKLQLARLKFEQGDFRAAYDLYYGLKLPVREKGRVYLERAWSKFYTKDYSKALGLLAVASTPMYYTANHYEIYILKMLIYRELCHYESVEATAEEFRKEFSSAIKDIKARRPLEKNYRIASMTLLSEKNQYRANFIAQLRDELKELRDMDWDNYKFYPRLIAAYENKDKQLQALSEKEIILGSRKVANDILDAEEQINFLDFTAKLDSLRVIRKGENRNYSSEKIPVLTFEKFYWPIENEHWYDELEDYTVLLRSRCGESQLLPAGSNSDIEKEFQ